MGPVSVPAGVDEVFRVLDLAGVLANALLGGVAARSAKLDLVGFACIAIVSGLGGGLLRDTLLQAGTPVALTDLRYLSTALVGACLAYVVPIKGRRWDYPLAVLDALAVGAWAVAGTAKTLGVGLGPLPAVLLGITTAVGGGAIRDVLLQRRPSIFGGNTLYATAALLASVVMLVGWRWDQNNLGLILGTLAGAGLCLLARWRGWILPGSYSWRPPAVSLRRRRRRELRRRPRGPRSGE